MATYDGKRYGALLVSPLVVPTNASVLQLSWHQISIQTGTVPHRHPRSQYSENCTCLSAKGSPGPVLVSVLNIQPHILAESDNPQTPPSGFPMGFDKGQKLVFPWDGDLLEIGTWEPIPEHQITRPELCDPSRTENQPICQPLKTMVSPLSMSSTVPHALFHQLRSPVSQDPVK